MKEGFYSGQREAEAEETELFTRPDAPEIYTHFSTWAQKRAERAEAEFTEQQSA
jgi:hypothetical protein